MQAPAFVLASELVSALVLELASVLALVLVYVFPSWRAQADA